MKIINLYFRVKWFTGQKTMMNLIKRGQQDAGWLPRKANTFFWSSNISRYGSVCVFFWILRSISKYLFNRTPLDHCFVHVTSVWLYTRPWKRNSYLSCQDHQPLANNTFDKVHDHVTYIIILHVYPVNLIVLALDAVDRIK